jgi:hypothetical protein
MYSRRREAKQEHKKKYKELLGQAKGKMRNKRVCKCKNERDENGGGVISKKKGRGGKESTTERHRR